MTTEKKQPLVYLLECGPWKSGWRIAEKALFNECKKWDQHLFTKDDILALYSTLASQASGFRNPPDLRAPDFKFAYEYDTSVGIVIGNNCSVHFTPVYGNYGR